MKGLMSMLVCLAVIMFSTLNSAAEEWKDGMVRIGTMAGMTGGFADVGQAQVMGVDDRIKYQNDELGGIAGHKIEHLWADMKTDVPTAIRLYKRWAALEPKPVEIAIGHSTAVQQLIKDFNKDKITNVTFNWNAPDIIPAGYLFWPVPGYADMVVAFGKWLKDNWDYSKKGMPTVGFLRWDHPCGVAIAEYGGKYCEQQGFFKVVADEIVPIGAVDVTSSLVKLSMQKPNFVYTMLLGSTPIAIKQADKMGILKDMQFVLRAYDTGKAYVNASGELADGLMGVMPCARLTDTDVPGIAKLLKVHKKYHGESEIQDDFSYIVGWLGADITIAASTNALKKHGFQKLTGETVKESLEELKNFDTGGITHSINFGPGTLGRRGNPYTRAIRYDYKGKQWKPITGWYQVPFLTKDGEYHE